MEWNMEDDHQITPSPSLRNEVNLFLQDVVGSLKTTVPSIYNVDTEYAKTRGNRSWFIIIMVGSVILLTGTGVLISARVISARMRNVSVGIETFGDLNLRNLLDMASRVESSLNSALEKKASLEGKQKTELDALSFDAERDRHIVHSLSLPPAEEAARIASIGRALAANRTAILARYAEPLNTLEAQIVEYRTQMTAFDRKRIEEAQQQQKSMNAEILRSELEKEQLKTYYEGLIADLQSQLDRTMATGLQSQVEGLDTVTERYRKEIAALDPVFSEEQGADILARLAALEQVTPFAETEQPSLAAAGLDPLIFNRLNDTYQKIEYLTDALLAIPWKHSAPSYVRALKSISAASLNEAGTEMLDFIAYAEARIEALLLETRNLSSRLTDSSHAYEALLLETQNLSSRLADSSHAYEARIEALLLETRNLSSRLADLSRAMEQSNLLIAEYQTYFKALAGKNGDAGSIINAKDIGDMLVYIDPLYGGRLENRRAFIFRAGSEYIGTIIVSGADGVFRAKVLELSRGKTPEANDRIVLDLRNEGAP
jgi:hypothetical protein